MLAIIGFLMLGGIMYFLFREKTIPVVVFALLPPIAALAAGFGIEELNEFIIDGIGTVSNMGILFIFSITFFGIMSDTGMFDVFVDFLVEKAGNNVLLVGLTTAFVACFAHLAGATITTVLITVPALLPVYRRLNLNVHLLLLITAAAMGVMNLLPWGGPVARVGAVLQMDANDVWRYTLPIQGFGVLCVFVLAFVMTLREQRRRQAIVEEQTAAEALEELEEKSEADLEKERLRRPNLVIFNVILTFSVIGLLIWGELPNYFIFMVGVSLALLVNYPDVKEQRARIRAHAGSALDVASVMMAAGIMVGILSKSGMLEAMVRPILAITPSFIATKLQYIMGALALPIGLTLGTDSYFYGLMPLVIEVGANSGVEPISIGVAMLIGKNLSLLISPFVPATFLAIGLAEVELSAHLRYSFIPLWILCFAMIIFGAVIGLI